MTKDEKINALRREAAALRKTVSRIDAQLQSLLACYNSQLARETRPYSPYPVGWTDAKYDDAL